MTTLAFNSFSKSTVRSPLFTGVQVGQAGKRWFHQSPVRQAIMMPAMSPFMTKGTITRWKKKEGEAFSAGDVLLQIESDIAMIDVEAESAGILGKIIAPDGTTNIPVEQVIALVVKDAQELANLSAQAPATPVYNPLPSPPSRPLPSPLHVGHFSQPLVSATRRSPSLFEMHSMGYSHRAAVRGMAMKHARGPPLTIIPPSPQRNIQVPFISVGLPSSRTHTLRLNSTTEREREGSIDEHDSHMDGVVMRRMIVSNLAQAPTSATLDSPSNSSKCEASEHF